MMRTPIARIPSMRPEPKRDRWGRYVLPDMTGVDQSWTRATTVAHTLDDTHGLTEWKRRKVIEGVAVNPILLRDVPRLARQVDEATHWRDAKEAKQALGDLCDEAARAAGADDGSNLGTLLHTITEYADAGRYAEIADQVPEELLDDLAAYLVTMRDAGIGTPPEYIERILINPAVEAAGTTDRILVMPEPCPDCHATLAIGDLKTQKSVDFGFLSIAIQLAEYAYAQAMVDPATGELVAMPAVCRCRGIVMHLPVGSGKCDLYELDLIEGWEYAQLAHRVRHARGRSKAIGWPYRYASTTAARMRDVANLGGVGVPEPVDQVRRRHILGLIRAAAHPDALIGLWRELSARGEWDGELTEQAAARRATLDAAYGEAS